MPPKKQGNNKKQESKKQENMHPSAIDVLKADHDRVKELFRQFEETGERAHKARQRLAEKAFQELEIHSRLEEELFYPAVREKASKEGKEVVLEGVEEHHVVDVLIEELKKMDPEDEAYQPKFKVLMENVEHHIEEEEGPMFAEARRVLDGDIQRLGVEIEQRRKELKRNR